MLRESKMLLGSVKQKVPLWHCRCRIFAGSTTQTFCWFLIKSQYSISIKALTSRACIFERREAPSSSSSCLWQTSLFTVLTERNLWESCLFCGYWVILGICLWRDKWAELTGLSDLSLFYLPTIFPVLQHTSSLWSLREKHQGIWWCSEFQTFFLKASPGWRSVLFLQLCGTHLPHSPPALLPLECLFGKMLGLFSHVACLLSWHALPP